MTYPAAFQMREEEVYMLLPANTVVTSLAQRQPIYIYEIRAVYDIVKG